MGGAGHNSASSKIERRFPVDPDTGAPLPLSEGGVCPEPKPTVEPKFNQSIGGCFGVCAPTFPGGQEGVKLPPHPHTGTTVVGMTKFSKLCDDEIARVKKTKATGAWGKHRTAKNPCKTRHGDAWQVEMQANTASKVHGHTCISQLSDWFIAKGNAAFEGSTAEGTWTSTTTTSPLGGKRSTRTVHSRRGSRSGRSPSAAQPTILSRRGAAAPRQATGRG